MCIGKGYVGALGFEWCKEGFFLGDVDSIAVLI